MGEVIKLANGRTITIGVNDLATTHPELVKEWNDELLPTHFTKGSNRDINWKCKEGHEWRARIQSRSSGSSCPVCDGREVLEGYNDLRTTHPWLVAEWADEDLSPTEYSYGSREEILWKCEEGHEWRARINSRSQGTGCPVCANKVLLSGFNDLATTHPELMKEWDFNANSLSPHNLSRSSGESVNWICSVCGEEWSSSIRGRAVSGNGCPVCARFERAKKSSATGLIVADIEELRERWDREKNTIPVERVLISSSESYWWRCSEGHSFLRSVNSEYKSHLCNLCGGDIWYNRRRLILITESIVFTHPHLIVEWADEDSYPSQFSHGSNEIIEWRCSQNKNHLWSARISDRVQGQGCPTCVGIGPSKKELEFQGFIKDLLPDEDTVFNDRTLIAPKELDVYIPSKQIAFEFNGLYWHTEEKGKDSAYHHIKYSECRSEGVQLIQIWEDDWDQKRTIVEEMVRNKLGLSDSVKIGARKTVVREIPSHESRAFLDEHHIQGFVGASKHYALKYDEEIVAVLSMKRRGGTEGEWELVRYATSVIVQGGFSKLLKHAIRELAPSKIITFSDNSLSDGGLYENTGFTLDAEISPDYSYLYRGERVHKFNFRLKRFRTDPELRYVEELTERELAELNEISRIWDSGKVRWVLTP